MTSPSLKRPLDFELPSHTTGPSGLIPNGSIFNGIKRRCNNFTPQSRPDTSGRQSGSVFKDPTTLLSPLNEDITSMIDEELNKAHNDHRNGNEAPVLTVRQTQIICEKLVKDREKKLRDEYDRILLSKLAEQYDTFVRFTHDHLEKRYSESNSHQASYLS